MSTNAGQDDARAVGMIWCGHGCRPLRSNPLGDNSIRKIAGRVTVPSGLRRSFAARASTWRRVSSREPEQSILSVASRSFFLDGKLGGDAAGGIQLR